MSDQPARPTAEALARYAEEFNQSRSMRFLGVRISFPEGAKVRADLEVRPDHLGGLGTSAVNGGVLAALFDLVIGCTPALIDPTRRSATVQLSMSFMKPVTGSRIHAEAVIDSRGSSMLFSRATIYDAEGRPCAKCDGLVRMSSLKWESGTSPAVN
ncbi:MAG: PaaI family thioesterase [Myxococcaceae bacterium]|nr:PaaI family thioesterase [Myxococcaceae bacterium]